MKLDLIINTYKSKDYLAGALESVAKQTIKDKVLVTLVEDGTDETYDELINEYGKMINIRFIKKPKNCGIGKARQFALDNTYLPFVAFLDSDDQLYDEKSLEVQLKEIENNDNISVVTSKIWLYGEPRLHLGNLLAKIYRRSSLEKHKIKFYNQKCGEDAVFNMQLFDKLKEEEIVDIDDVTYRHIVQNEQSITHIYNDIKWQLDGNIKYYKKFLRKNKGQKTNTRMALISIMGMYYGFHEVQKKVPVDELTRYYQACSKLYRTFKKEIDLSLQKKQHITFYRELKDFVKMISEY